MADPKDNAQPRREYSVDNFDLDNFDATAAQADLQAIHLCCLRNELNEGDEAGQPPTNHWVLCLQTSETSSLMFDMAPGYGSDGLRGKIGVLPLDEKYTDETLHVFTDQPLRTVNIQEFMQLVCENGRDAFDFSPEWEGCRFWLMVVMRDLEEAGWLEKGSADQAREVLELYWRNPEGSEPRVMREGTFRK